MDSKRKKSLIKSVEADLTRQVEVQNARQLLKCFSKTGGRSDVPITLLRDAVKTLYKHTRAHTVRKEKRLTKKISKCAEKIDENEAVLNDLLGDVLYDTNNILDTFALNDPQEEEGEEKNNFILPALERRRRRRNDVSLPEAPKDDPSSDTDDDNNPGEATLILSS